MSAAAPLARREGLVLTVLIAAVLLTWAFLAWAVLDMSHPLARLMMPPSAAWAPATAAAVVLMWSVMMAAMMLPSATPMVLLFAQLARRGGGSRAATWAFVAAYVLAWAAFSVVAAALHWVLQRIGLVSPMMVSTSPILTAALLITAGVYQFTRLKAACLTRCRSPLAFLMAEWRKGTAGAFIMGLRHGTYCIGCCWALMTLLFVVGVMNLPLVAMLALAITAEKLTPWGEWIARGVGIALILGGGLVLAVGMGPHLAKDEMAM